MQVKCPHCETIFKVADEHLNIADGMVRCGFCKEVFNAREHGATPAEAPEPEAKENETVPTGTGDEAATATQPAEARHAEAKPAETEPPAEPSVTRQTGEPLAREQQASSAKDDDTDDDFFTGVQSKLIPDEFRIPDVRPTYSTGRDIAWSLAILVLTVCLFVEYAWFNRNHLASNPELGDWFAQLCNNTDCAKLGLRDPSQIEMVARNIYSHPNISDALMISITMVNHASFPQPYPRVNIDFSDVRGQVVASRIFSPEEYLQLDSHSIRPLHAGESMDFHLEIQDPGPQAMTYEFNFL